MATDDDTELRDMIIQTLEKKGILGKIKAELRASVFLALEEQEELQDRIPLCNKSATECLNTSIGKLAASIVREFLEFFNLNFTLAVFTPEASFECMTKEELLKHLGLEHKTDSPVLVHLLNRSFHLAQATQTANEISSKANSSSSNFTKEQINNGKKEFFSSKGNSFPDNETKHTEVLEEKGQEDIETSVENDRFFDESHILEQQKEGDLVIGNLKSLPRNQIKTSENLNAFSVSGEEMKEKADSASYSGLTDLKNLPTLDGFPGLSQKQISDGSGYRDYFLDEDFHSSLSENQDSKHSHKSVEQDLSKDPSIEEELDDLTAVDDLLNNSLSLGDGSTTDCTISQSSNVEGCDYTETFS